MPDFTEHAKEIRWRDREFLTMQMAGEIAGVSPATLYGFAKKGELKLERFAGRTVTRPAELLNLLEKMAADWQPNERSARAVKARTARTQMAWS